MKLLALAALITFTTAPLAMADRAENQAERIQQGVDSGSLTTREANRLNAQQERINNRRSELEANGNLTAQREANLNARENRASRAIYAAKHNARSAK